MLHVKEGGRRKEDERRRQPGEEWAKGEGIRRDGGRKDTEVNKAVG